MKTYLLFLFTLLFLFFLFSEPIIAQQLDSTKLPIIVLNTNGQTIIDNPRINVFMGIIDNGSGNINHITDPYTNYNGTVSIEIRGSTSQQYPKISYAFSPINSAGIQFNYEILGLPSENDWILYGPYTDKTLMRNTIAYYLANKMGHYASRTKYVELMCNGIYLGVYELQEKIKQDDNRVDIAKLKPSDTTGDNLSGGYIIKIDKNNGAVSDTFQSSYDPGVYFLFHDPEDSKLMPVQKKYIINYIDSFETALMSPWYASPDSGFRKYADENSFIDFCLLQELGHTVDGYRSSCFMYKDKDSKGGKFSMGPIWDFDYSFGNANYCNAYDTIGWQYPDSICPFFSPHIPFWWKKLIQNTEYKNSMQCRWNLFRSSFLHTDSINNWIDSNAAYLQEAQQRNFIKWPILGVPVNLTYYVGQTYQDEVNYLKMWIQKRSEWIDNNLPGVCNSVNIKENQLVNQLRIFPNPSNGNFSILFNKVILTGSIEILNSMGEIVFKDLVTNQDKKEIRLYNVAGGIYVAKIYDGKYFSTGKIVIQ